MQRLSSQAQTIVRLAEEIARESGQEYVGTEHVLLAIVREGTGLGAKLLARRNVTPERLKVEVDKLIESSLEETWVFGRLPGSPHYRNVVAKAIEQAQQLEAREVCSEHLVLALLKEKDCVACNALANLGVRYTDVRQDLLEHAA
ncbi:MAG TPA: Clp protease N-terminal domain-containing protein [Phycisphaerae bacterium]|jgi:ATP-dependent Clp protease ATP-binding subunit ClpC